MKIDILDSSIIVPLTINHHTDPSFNYTYYQENFDFGLTLNSYNILDNIKDRKSNYGTSYFLSDTQPLSSITEIQSPQKFENVSTFVSYIKNDNTYFKFSKNTSDTGSPYEYKINTATTTTEVTSINYFDIEKIDFDSVTEGSKYSDYFFTFTLIDNETLTISKEVNDQIYYYHHSSYTDANNNDVIGFSRERYKKEDGTENDGYIFNYTIDNDNNIRLSRHDNRVLAIGSLNALVLKNPGVDDDLTGFILSSGTDYSKTVFKINRKPIITKQSTNINNQFSKYKTDYNKSNINLNNDGSKNSIDNNYFMYSNYHSLDYCKQYVKADIIPLKNQATLEEYYIPNNHYNTEPEEQNRVYNRIYSGANELNGYDKIQLGYNIGTKDIHFEPSKLTYFTTPPSLSPYEKINLNDSKIERIGGTAGNSPLLSDKVFKRRIHFKDNTFSDEVNSTYYCSWLSGHSSGKQIWVDRYYNPDFIDYDSASLNNNFFDTVTEVDGEEKYIIDVTSKLTFETKNDYAYYHIGYQDYRNHIQSLQKYLLSQNLRVYDSSGEVYNLQRENGDLVIDFNGDRYGKLITDHKGDFSICFALSANDFSLPIGYSIMGNYFEEGFEIFNTDYVTPNIYLPVDDKVLLINNNLEIYDELELTEYNETTREKEPVNVKGIIRKDIFNELYIIGDNNIIYEYTSNLNLINKLTKIADEVEEIYDTDVTEDKIYITYLSTDNSRRIFSYDKTNNEQETGTFGFIADESDKKIYKYFVNPTDDTGENHEADQDIKTGNEIAILNNYDTFTIKQKNPNDDSDPSNIIYKGDFDNDNNSSNDNNSIHVSGDSIITNIICDDDDELLVLQDNNIISRLNEDRKLLQFKKLDFLNESSKKYIDVILDFEKNVYLKYYIIVETLEDETILHKLDRYLNLVDTKSLGNNVVNSLQFTKSITSFYYLKKYKSEKNVLRTKLRVKPKYTSSGRYSKTTILLDYDISNLSPGYNHFCINVSLSSGFLELYVNGIKYGEQEFDPGKFLLDNPLGSGILVGTLSTPYYISLSERLDQRGKYILDKCKIRGLKLYSKVLNYFEIRSHIKIHENEEDVVWSMPIGQRAYIDTIDRVFKFNIPEKVTNTFDIEINKLDVSDRVILNDIRKEIEKEIPKIIPYYDKLNNIVINNDTYNCDCKDYIIRNNVLVLPLIYPPTNIFVPTPPDDPRCPTCDNFVTEFNRITPPGCDAVTGCETPPPPPPPPDECPDCGGDDTECPTCANINAPEFGGSVPEGCPRLNCGTPPEEIIECPTCDNIYYWKSKGRVIPDECTLQYSNRRIVCRDRTTITPPQTTTPPQTGTIEPEPECIDNCDDGIPPIIIQDGKYWADCTVCALAPYPNDLHIRNHKDGAGECKPCVGVGDVDVYVAYQKGLKTDSCGPLNFKYFGGFIAYYVGDSTTYKADCFSEEGFGRIDPPRTGALVNCRIVRMNCEGPIEYSAGSQTCDIYHNESSAITGSSSFI